MSFQRGCLCRTIASSVSVVIVALAGQSPTFARDADIYPEDVHWSSAFGRPGIDGTVIAATLFEGDLVVAGDFSRAGDTPAWNIARWDGEEWHALGAGLDIQPRALTVFDGKLVAGGWGVSLWDGTAWEPLAARPPSHVNALAVYQGQLIAGLDYIWPPTTDALRGVVRWDGASWQPLGGGVDGAVRSLAVQAGSLIVGGPCGKEALRIGGVIRWDGSAWTGLGQVPLSEVRALLAAGDELYTCGMSFPVVDDDDPLPTPLLFRWDGAAWQGVGSPHVGSPYVCAIAMQEGAPVIAGNCHEPYGTSWKVMRLNGATWDSIFASPGAINVLCMREERLFAAGDIHQGDPPRFEGIAQRDGAVWDHVGGPSEGGIAGYVGALAYYDGNLFAAGDLMVAGSELVRSLARWDGAEWHPVPCEPASGIKALQVYRGGLIAAGDLRAQPGCAPFNRIARWNGGGWESLAQGLPSGTPLAMTVYRGALIVGGYKMNIARWDGTEWSSLGEGIGQPSPQLYEYWVSDFTELNGDLIAAGKFRTAGTGEAGYTIARWDGTSWHSMGLELGSTTYEGVRSVAAYRGAVYAVGDFTPNDRTYGTDVARWEGASWTVLPGSSIGVRMLTTFGPHLVAGCCVSCRAAGLRCWDGTSWIRLGSGLTGNSREGGDGWGLVDAVLVQGPKIYAGGSFTGAGGDASYAIACWDSTEAPRAPALPPRPNPAAQNVAIDFDLSQPSDVSLWVYDVQGRRIARLFEGPLGAGRRTVAWDGRGASGERVSSGVYVARLEAAGSVRSWKIVIVR